MDKVVRGLVPLKGVVAAGSAAAALALVVTTAVFTPAPVSARSAEVSSFDREIADFYRARGGAPLWFAPNNSGAAQHLVDLLATAQADNLNPRRYNTRALARVIADARTGNPAAIQRAEVTLSNAFVTDARDLKHDPQIGIIYVDNELKPEPPSATEILTSAARAPSLGNYIQQIGWMNPIYAKLRQAIASRIYRNAAEYRLLQL